MAPEDKKHLERLARITSKERDDALIRLQNAFSDGRLDEHDFDERMEKALTAKTAGELSAIFIDLPSIEANTSMSSPTIISPKLGLSALVVLSGIEQRGRFILPSHYRIKAVLGGCLLDLSEAQFESFETTIHVTAILGGVQIFVPKGIHVTVHSSPILGGIFHNIGMEKPPHDAPHIHIFAKAVLGGIEIKSID